MNFMEDSEFLLLLDTPLFSTADKVRLHEAGIRTSHEQPAWDMIEPTKGEYNFGYLENLIQSNRDAGMKSLIMISGWKNPKWMPDGWFAKDINGNVCRDCLSFWNEEAQIYSDGYYCLLRDTYRNQKDVAFFFGEFQGGEAPQASGNLFYDVSAVDDYKKTYGTDAMPDINKQDTLDWFGKKVIEHCIRKTEILYPVWHEMWNAYQHLMNKWNKGYGIYVQPELLKKYHDMHPDGTVVLLQYTYYDSSHEQDNVNYVDMLRDISKCEVIVEAMFCNGLSWTTPKAIAKGFRGQIIYPGRSGFDNEGLDSWMVEQIRKSNDLWRASKGL